MVRNTSNGKNHGSIDNKTAVIKVEEPGGDVRVFEAQHYIKSDDGTISIYTGARSDGIDYQAHVERCTIDRGDAHADDMNAYDEFDGVDHVEYDGERYRLFDVIDPDTVVLDKVHEDTIDAPADECTPVDDGNTTDDDGEEPRLVTDGGRDVPACTCGADLFETAELDTAHYPATGQGCRASAPRMVEGPAAECGACDALVGAMYGMEAVVALWEARGETLPGNNDNDDGDRDDDEELVTDGGRELDNGDSVLHAGEQYRVGRCDGERVEIYQLGGESRIVPINAVTPVPEVGA